MGNTLFDQLKKSGLADKNKANKIKQDKYKNKKQKNKGGANKQLDESKLLAQKALVESAERDRKINLQKKEQADRKAIAAQIKQLIERHSVQDQDGEITYNFTDAGMVKHLYVSEQGYQLLTSGRLAIAKLGESYQLVPLIVAEKIKQRDPDSIISTKTKTEAEPSDDDPYADYAIPDDLMW